MSSFLKKIAPIALGLAVPGIGSALGLAAGSLGATALGAGAGALGGALSGGGLKGALIGGVSGGLGSSGVAGSIGSKISNAAGLAGKGASTIGNALTGAGLGYATGGKEGALLGAAAGGLGANAGDIGRSIFGTEATTPLGAGVQGPSKPATPGLLGTSGSISLGGAGQTPTATGGSMFTKLSDVLSGVQETYAQDKLKKQLLASQAQSQAALAPYLASGAQANQQLASNLASGFDASNLYNDPGYQFTKQQGEEAINRSLGATGNVFSGRALKAAQDYGTGLADQTYNDAYNRWLQGNQQLAGAAGTGLQATGAATQVYDNEGNIRANNTLEKSNILSRTLSSVLGGSGNLRIIGYDNNGQPIYSRV